MNGSKPRKASCCGKADTLGKVAGNRWSEVNLTKPRRSSTTGVTDVGEAIEISDATWEVLMFLQDEVPKAQMENHSMRQEG